MKVQSNRRRLAARLARPARREPKAVGATPECVYIMLSSTGAQRRGLSVPRAAGFALSGAMDPSYTPAGRGVFPCHLWGQRAGALAFLRSDAAQRRCLAQVSGQ